MTSVDIAYQALSDTGKDPRKDRFFKKRAGNADQGVDPAPGRDWARPPGVADRETVADKVREEVSEIHDNLLKGIMSKKKK